MLSFETDSLTLGQICDIYQIDSEQLLSNLNGVSRYVGVLLITKNNEIIMQQRDDNSKTTDAGLITTFGGEVKANESREQALERVLEEELDIKLRGKHYSFWRNFYKTKSKYVQDCECSIFIAKDIVLEDLKKEGKGYVLVTKANYKRLTLSTLALEIAEEYFKIFCRSKQFLVLPLNEGSH